MKASRPGRALPGFARHSRVPPESGRFTWHATLHASPRSPARLPSKARKACEREGHCRKIGLSCLRQATASASKCESVRGRCFLAGRLREAQIPSEVTWPWRMPPLTQPRSVSSSGLKVFQIPLVVWQLRARIPLSPQQHEAVMVPQRRPVICVPTPSVRHELPGWINHCLFWPGRAAARRTSSPEPKTARSARYARSACCSKRCYLRQLESAEHWLSKFQLRPSLEQLEAGMAMACQAVVAVTYTRKAAEELAQRVKQAGHDAAASELRVPSSSIEFP